MNIPQSAAKTIRAIPSDSINWHALIEELRRRYVSTGMSDPFALQTLASWDSNRMSDLRSAANFAATLLMAARSRTRCYNAANAEWVVETDPKTATEALAEVRAIIDSVRKA